MLKSACVILGIAVLMAVGPCGASQPVAPGHPYLLADGPQPVPPTCWPWSCANQSGGASQPVALAHPYLLADGPQPVPPTCWPWSCATSRAA
jgi:hypothetical protein